MQYTKNLSDIRRVFTHHQGAGRYGDFLINPGVFVYNLKMNNVLLAKKEFGVADKKSTRWVVRDGTMYTEPLVLNKGAIALPGTELELSREYRNWVVQKYADWFFENKDLTPPEGETLRIKLPKRIRGHQIPHFREYAGSNATEPVIVDIVDGDLIITRQVAVDEVPGDEYLDFF